jgi:hypothetical protein
VVGGTYSKARDRARDWCVCQGGKEKTKGGRGRECVSVRERGGKRSIARHVRRADEPAIKTIKDPAQMICYVFLQTQAQTLTAHLELPKSGAQIQTLAAPKKKMLKK